MSVQASNFHRECQNKETKVVDEVFIESEIRVHFNITGDPLI